MSEPKTLREYLNRPVTSEEAETEGRWDRIMIKHNDPIYDAHIIEGGLVSPEIVERCAKRLCKHVCVQRGGNPESAWRVQADQYRAEALAVLSAAGYEQWDEVVTGVVLKNGEWIPEGPSMLGRGYGHGERVTIAIKRKEE